MFKVSIIGVGRVGSTLSYSLISNPKLDELFLYDVVDGKAEGAILDVAHAYPGVSHKLRTGPISDTEGSKLIIITAGLPRTPDMKTRMDLLEANKKIMEDIINSSSINDDTVLLITTNPVEHVGYIAYKLSGLESGQVIGFSNYLHSQRMRFLISRKTGVAAEKISCIVIGEHGENMIPLFSQSKIDGKEMEEFELSEENIVGELRGSSKQIIKLVGGTQFGPAKSLTEVASSIIQDSKKTFPLSHFVSNEHYGVKDVFISLPVEIGKNGVERVKELDINKKEKDELGQLAEKLGDIQQGLG